MTNDKCREVLDRYEQFVTSDYTRMVNRERIDHLATMIPKMREMLDTMLPSRQPVIDQREKFMRWLGFIQGVLWTEQLFTLNELKEHNRP